MAPPTRTPDADPSLDEADDALLAAVLSPGALYSVAQPILRLSDARVVGYELLARCDDVPGAPPHWLAAADRVGRRAELELACVAAAARLGAPPGGALVFVNVGPDVVGTAQFAQAARALPRHALEITEDAAVDDYDRLRSVLAGLRATGSLIAIDDAGSGYASMSHVLNLTPSFVKIDMSVVRGVHTDPGRQALVRAMRAFASAIGAVTVAEGVETTQDLQTVRDLGVELAQGYVIARPGTPWPQVRPEARRVLLPDAEPTHAHTLVELASALAACTTWAEACDEVGAFLATLPGTMPSIYLERGGVLRCCSRRGQWLVLDGLHPGSGLTGTAFSTETELLVPDVTADPRYRMAIPGVRAELAVPIRVDGRTVGVCNVETVTSLPAQRCTVVREAVRLLEERLSTLTVAGHDQDTSLDGLAHAVTDLMAARTIEDLVRRTGPVAAQVSGMDSSCLWSTGPDGWTLTAHDGPSGAALATLASAQVAALADLVEGIASCSSGGNEMSLTALPWGAVPDGVRAALVLPLRGPGGSTHDLLLLTSTTAVPLGTRTAISAETCCAVTAGRLADLRPPRRWVPRSPGASGMLPAPSGERDAPTPATVVP